MVKVEGPCEKVSAEMMEAHNFMNARKTAELNGMTSEILKECEKESVKRQTNMANDMLEGKI